MGALLPLTIAVAIDGPMDPADLPRLAEVVRRLLHETRARALLCDCRTAAADAVTIDALARIRLAACRSGATVELRHASMELRGLLAFAGLARALGLEPGGQPEEGEQPRGVEVEGQLDDPAP